MIHTPVLGTTATAKNRVVDDIQHLLGDIYTLTVRDAEQVALWLTQNGIIAKAYHGSVESEGFANSTESE